MLWNAAKVLYVCCLVILRVNSLIRDLHLEVFDCKSKSAIYDKKQHAQQTLECMGVKTQSKVFDSSSTERCLTKYPRPVRLKMMPYCGVFFDISFICYKRKGDRSSPMIFPYFATLKVYYWFLLHDHLPRHCTPKYVTSHFLSVMAHI